MAEQHKMPPLHDPAMPLPAVEIEPLLSLRQFTASLPLPGRAALMAWMEMQQLDTWGHYSQHAWEDYWSKTLAHPVTE